MSGIALCACIMLMFIKMPYVPMGMTHKYLGLYDEDEYFTQGAMSEVMQSSDKSLIRGSIR